MLLNVSFNDKIIQTIIVIIKYCVFWFCPADFIPSLKRLFRNSIFVMMILAQLVAVNGFIGMITFKPKYMEQIYGQSASKSIFLIGTEADPGALCLYCSQRQMKQCCFLKEV